MEKEINVNGNVYVLKSEIELEKAKQFNGMDYCIVRTYSAGVFAGYVESRNGKEVVIRKARRIWYWNGANELVELAVNGTCKPNDCKFSIEADKIEVTEAIEVINCTEKAQQSIEEVKAWLMK